MTAEHDADSPRQMLDLMDRTRRDAVRRVSGRYGILLVVWAIAWGVGFGVLWCTAGVGGVDLIPTATGWWIFAAALVIAIVWSTIAGILGSRDGVRGRSQLQGALYGFSWTIAMVAAALFIWGLQRNGLPEESAQLLYPGLYIFLVGVLYLAGGALFRAIPLYVLGGLLIVMSVIATFVGSPTHFLVYAIAGPIAMLVVASLVLWGPLWKAVKSS